MGIWVCVTVIQHCFEMYRSRHLDLQSTPVSRSFRPFIGLFGRGSWMVFRTQSIQHRLLPLPVSTSLHHLRIQQTNKAGLCQYFFKGLDGRQPCGSLFLRALVPHNLSLFTTSLRMRVMTTRVWMKPKHTSIQAFIGNTHIVCACVRV